MADANIRVINITLNPFELRNEDSNFEIRCGENVRLVFSLPEGATDLQLTENGTLQVEAINALNGFKALAKEGTYTVGALSELNAQIEFNSEQTAYGSTQAGAYNLIVALKDASGNIVLSGVVPFNLYDVGYDGIAEPPESFRDEVLEAATQAQAAAQQAQTAETNAAASATQAQASATQAQNFAESAESAKTAAETASTQAQSAATQAATDKTTTETYKNAAESAKNAAELAKTQAQEISDPENRIGSLQILKQNGGQLHLNGGYATTNCKPTFGAAQSLLFTYEVSEAELDAKPWSIIGNSRIWNNNKGIGFAKNSSKEIQCGFNWGGTTETRSLLTATTAQFADGKPHAWALICGKNETNGFFKLYRDGVLINSKMSLAMFDDFIPEYGFSFGKHQTSGSSDTVAKGRLSRIAFFSFDVSESNADYTLADYQSGKSIPPSLNIMTPQELLALKESDVASLQYSTWHAGDVQYSAAWEGDYFVLKTTAETTITSTLKSTFNIIPYYTLSANIPAGTRIEVSFEDWVFNTTYFSQYSEVPSPTNPAYYGWLTVGIEAGDINHGEVRSDKNFKFIAYKASQRLYLMNHNLAVRGNVGDTIPADTVIYKVKGLKIKANGAALNLENYTIARNTTTRLIKDLSAGGYDATITNAINGDMDRRVEVFVDELKTQIAQSTATA